MNRPNVVLMTAIHDNDDAQSAKARMRNLMRSIRANARRRRQLIRELRAERKTA